MGERACVGRNKAGNSESLKAWETDSHQHVEKSKNCGHGAWGVYGYLESIGRPRFALGLKGNKDACLRMSPKVKAEMNL